MKSSRLFSKSTFSKSKFSQLYPFGRIIHRTPNQFNVYWRNVSPLEECLLVEHLLQHWKVYWWNVCCWNINSVELICINVILECQLVEHLLHCYNVES